MMIEVFIYIHSDPGIAAAALYVLLLFFSLFVT